MTTYAPTIPHGHDRPSLPNQPFFSWLRTHTALFIGQIIGLLSAISFLLALIYNWRRVEIPILNSEIIGQFIIYLHFPFLVVFIAVLIRVLDKNSRGRYRAGLVYEKLKGKNPDQERLAGCSEKQVGTFKRRFLRFWCAMLLLYLAFAIKPIFPPPPDLIVPSLPWRDIGPLLFPFLTFALNNVSLLFIFSCFVALYLPTDCTLPDSGPEAAPAKTPSDETRSGHFLRFAEGITRRLGGRDLHKLQLRHRTLHVVFSSLVVVLTFAFPLIMVGRIMANATTDWREYSAIFNALSGTLNAVVLALLIARLDSKLIALPSWLICILYSYAGVQPLFVVFELRPDLYEGIKSAVFLVVFVFKIYFFLIIIYSLQTGRMFNYFFCSRILNDHVRTMKDQRATPKETPLPVSGDAKPVEPPTDRPAEKESPKSNGTRPGKTADDDHLLVWGERLGALATIAFVVPLLGYAAGSENMKVWLASSSPTYVLIVLHLLLLLIFSVWFFVTWYRRRKVSPPSEPSKSKELSRKFRELSKQRFEKLSEPEFKEVSEPDFDKDLSDLTEKQSTAFTKYFLCFWISLLLLYAGLLWAKYRAPKADAQVALAAQKQAALSDKTLPPSYRALIASTQTAGGRISEPTMSTLKMLGKVRYSLLLFVLNNFTALSVFCCFGILYMPRDDSDFEAKLRLTRRYSLLIAFLLTLLTPLLLVVVKGNAFTQSDVDQISTLFAAVGGTLNAVAFALLIARLDSRIIGIPSSLIAVLYGYAALQPLFVAFNQSTNVLRAIETSAVIAALLFKICLILIVVHVARTRGLRDYLWFFPVLHRSVNSVFHNQFEITAYGREPGSFTFSIFDRNVERYRTEASYSTKAQCDEAVEKLVDLMKERKNYSTTPKELRGTYWIQIRPVGGDLVCESTDLRSADEVVDLIEESIEKVPYCKYSRA